MKRAPVIGLGLKLSLIAVASLLALLALVSFHLFQTSARQLELHEQRRTQEVRTLVTVMLADALVRRDAADVLDRIDRLLDGETDLRYIEVRDIDGRLIARRGEAALTTAAHVVAEIRLGGQAYGEVAFALSTAHLAAARNALLRSFVIDAVLVALLATAVFASLGHLLTRRLRALTESAAAIAAGELQPQLPPARDDEIGRLQEAFAAMAAALKSRLEELARAQQAAEAANEAKTTFLAQMSHQLRTPLNGILGMAELARRSAVDAKQADQLSKLIQAAQRLNELLADILEIARLDAQRLAQEKSPFTFAALFDALARRYSALAREKDVTLEFQIDAPLAEREWLGDGIHLERALAHLIDHAIKLCASGGRVLVNAAAGSPKASTRRVRLTVSHSAAGIDPADLPRLLEPVASPNAPLLRRFEEVGLGLPLAERLVRLLGGQLAVQSQPPHGSAFWFEIDVGALATREGTAE